LLVFKRPRFKYRFAKEATFYQEIWRDII